MNVDGYVGYALFDIIDNVIAELEQRVAELEWELADEAQVERLKLSLDYRYRELASGQVLLPRF